MCFSSGKICGTVSTGLPTVFQIGLGDAFRVDVNVTEVEIVAFFSQFFRQFFSADTIRTAGRPKITANMQRSNWIFNKLFATATTSRHRKVITCVRWRLLCPLRR